jgi:hypothetical protein
MLLKEEDVDQFKDFIANYVGIELFGDVDYTIDKAEADEYETEADDKDGGSEELYTSITIDFAITSNGYNEDSWWAMTRGCTRTFYEEDFDKFYGIVEVKG